MENTSRNTVVGLFNDERSAQQVVDTLTQNGFSSSEVHLSSGANYAGDAASGGSVVTGRTPSEHHGGGFTGWLSSLFGGDDYAPEDTGRYAEAVQRGSYVVAVDTDQSKIDRAVEVMNQYGVVDIDQHAAMHGYGNAENLTSPTASGETGAAIPVVEEQLQVGKRAVQRGGVRVYSRVVDQPVEENVQLREEKVTVERRPVNRPVTDADRDLLRDQTFEVTEMAEEAVVSKQARVVEEVRVGKETSQKTQTVRDTVRRTEVQTENLGASEAGNYTDDFRRDFQTRYGSSGGAYETYAPAYEYGYRMAGDSRYKGGNWTDVESELKSDYMRNNPNSTWEKAKDAVRYGWDRMTGQR